MKRILPKSLSALALAAISAPTVWSQSTPPALGDAAKAERDSINASLDQFESMARRSILNGGSKPISFSGEADGKLVGSAYSKYPAWMQSDESQSKNSDVALRIGMVASPNRNLRLWSKIAFNNALLGSTTSGSTVAGDGKSTTPLATGWTRSTQTGEAGFKIGSLVYEDMAVGAISKIGPTTWSAKFGGVLWNQLSPLTVWKMQPRIFAWDYLPFELEQSTAQFYDYGTIKGEKAGRAAWNKKPFMGIQLESVELPWGLYLNGLWGFYEGYNKNQPWLVPDDKNLQLQYTEDNSSGTEKYYRSYATKGTGIADNYRKVYFGRLAKEDLPYGLGAGLNWFSYNIDKEYPKQWAYVPTTEVGKSQTLAVYANGGDTTRTYNNNYYVEPQVGSFDLRRSVPGGVSFHVDLAMSHADSVFYKVDTGADNNAYYRADMQAKALTVGEYEEIGRTSTGWVPALYADVSAPVAIKDFQMDAELRNVVLPKKFQSPTSPVAPVDGIFPYEANMTGAGKFIGMDNGTAYASNMAGSNLILKFPVPRGHAKLSWGLHGQMESGKDMIYFPWRQNGAAFVQTLASDFTQYDEGLIDDYLRSSGSGAAQARRLGDEFFYAVNGSNAYAPQYGDVGGVRGTYLNTYEGFAAYKLTGYSGTDRDAWMEENRETVNELENNYQNGSMPQSSKFTQNLSLDYSYDLARLWNGKHSVFLAGYLAFNSVTKESRGGIPAFSSKDDNVLLASRYIRFEPVFQVTSKFYVIGLIGNETWSSRYGVALLDSSSGALTLTGANEAKYKLTESNLKKYLVRAPIDYNDWTYGIGFNWDMAQRVALNVRCQRLTHEDKGISVDCAAAEGINDYKAWLTTAEVKMWF